MAKMTQTQLVTEMSTKTGITKKQVKQKRKARMGRNPATGEEIKIPAKTVLKFRVAKAAKDAVLGAAKK